MNNCHTHDMQVFEEDRENKLAITCYEKTFAFILNPQSEDNELEWNDQFHS